MSTAIVNDRIDGTRITVWDIVHYLEGEWAASEIADALKLSLEQVESAIEYIANDRERIYEIHEQIEARIAKGNPPEVVEMIERSHERFEKWKEDKLNQKQLTQSGEDSGRDSGGYEL